MEPNLKVDEQPSVATLVGDIIADAQKLVRQELALARTEVQEEWTKAKSVAFLLSAAGLVVGMGGILLAFGVVHALAAATGLPLWADYGIVALVLLGGGYFLYAKGAAQASKVDFVPHETVESIKENVQWIRNQT